MENPPFSLSLFHARFQSTKRNVTNLMDNFALLPKKSNDCDPFSSPCTFASWERNLKIPFICYFNSRSSLRHIMKSPAKTAHNKTANSKRETSSSRESFLSWIWEFVNFLTHSAQQSTTLRTFLITSRSVLGVGRRALWPNSNFPTPTRDASRKRDKKKPKKKNPSNNKWNSSMCSPPPPRLVGQHKFNSHNEESYSWEFARRLTVTSNTGKKEERSWMWELEAFSLYVCWYRISSLSPSSELHMHDNMTCYTTRLFMSYAMVVEWEISIDNTQCCCWAARALFTLA